MTGEFEAWCSILSVDDNTDVREMLHEMITRLGHASAIAVDGVEALEYLRTNQVDIVITDINMPRLHGMELISRIRGEFEDIDIIAVTGYHHRYKYTDVIEAGASDFISKPFNINELEAKINRIIRERLQREQLRLLSVRDGLTGLYNRRHFDDNLRREAIRAFRQHYGLYILIIDVDNFKEYNDKFGHQRGDQLLRELARIMTLYIRNNVDSAYRYGGDEFAVLIPHADEKQSLMIAERLRSKYNECKLAPTSLSIGIAKLNGGLDSLHENIDSLLRRADQSLYHAKKSGGDQAHADAQSEVCEATLDEKILSPQSTKPRA